MPSIPLTIFENLRNVTLADASIFSGDGFQMLNSKGDKVDDLSKLQSDSYWELITLTSRRERYHIYYGQNSKANKRQKTMV